MPLPCYKCSRKDCGNGFYGCGEWLVWASQVEIGEDDEYCPVCGCAFDDDGVCPDCYPEM